MPGLLDNPLAHIGIGLLTNAGPSRDPINPLSGALAGVLSHQQYQENQILRAQQKAEHDALIRERANTRRKYEQEQMQLGTQMVDDVKKQHYAGVIAAGGDPAGVQRARTELARLDPTSFVSQAKPFEAEEEQNIFPGTGFETSSANAIIMGFPPHQREAVMRELARQRLTQPKTLTTPEGVYKYPGFNMDQLSQVAGAVQSPSGPQATGTQVTEQPPGSVPVPGPQLTVQPPSGPQLTVQPPSGPQLTVQPPVDSAVATPTALAPTLDDDVLVVAPENAPVTFAANQSSADAATQDQKDDMKKFLFRGTPHHANLQAGVQFYPKIKSGEEKKALFVAKNLINYDAIIDGIKDDHPQFDPAASKHFWGNLLPAGLDALVLSEPYQKFKSASGEWTSNIVFLTSGASVTETEREEKRKNFFPRPFEGPGVVKHKAFMRKLAMETAFEMAVAHKRLTAEQAEQAYENIKAGARAGDDRRTNNPLNVRGG
jgi:hypothetical protein